MTRSLLLFTLFSSALFAQSQSIYPSVLNAATFRPNIAQGSYASISGPTGGFNSVTINLITSDGVSAQLSPIIPPNQSSGGPPTILWFIIPPKASLGSANVATVVNGTPYNNSIEIVETAPGIFASSYNGYGPALALNHPSTPNALTAAAVPGGIVSLFATGLNGATTADVSVEFAHQPIAPLYAGPQGQAALDQINFVVPQDTAFGCYVPVAIRVRGILSNQTTLSINKDPYACAHPLGLTYSDLKTLDSGGSVQLAELSISNDISSSQAPRELANLNFSFWNAAGVAVQSGVQMNDAQLFSCYFSTVLSGVYQSPTGGNAGAVTISGPNGKQLELQLSSGLYSAAVSKDQLPYFFGGPWQLSATGSSDFGAFQQNFTLPPPLNFTNLDNSTIIPSQGYTLHWDASGFGPDDILDVTLTVGPTFESYATCTAPAVAGQLLLPNSVLETFKGKSATILANIRTKTGESTQFSVPINNNAPIRSLIDYSFLQRFTTQIQ